MFSLTDKEIVPSKEVLESLDPRSGGLVFFEGRVRYHNEGHSVKSLEYQCYDEMAINEGEKIIKSAFTKFDIHSAKCIHRYGHLNIKDIAVWVAVGSSHRKEAFQACEYIIDQVKCNVPIWKKEYYVDQKPVWVACHHCQSVSSDIIPLVSAEK